MFTKNNRKGFTVVELVIVIAIIAILATALIPTFGGLIDSANETADQQTVRQMNTILLAEGLLNGEVDVKEVKGILIENGFNDAFELAYKKHQLGWYAKDGVVVLIDTEQNKITYPTQYAELAVTDVAAFNVMFAADADELIDKIASVGKDNSYSSVVLSQDITLSKQQRITIADDAAVEIDLNGHTFTSTARSPFAVSGNGDLTIINGSVVSEGGGNSYAVGAFGTADVTLKDVTIHVNNNGVYSIGTNGDLSTDTKVILDNVTIVGSSDINILYLPAGDVTITNSEIHGASLVCGGKITIENTEFYGNGANEFGTTYKGTTGANGTSASGYMDRDAAIAEANRVGQCALLSDVLSIYVNRGGEYTITSVTIKNCSFQYEDDVAEANRSYALRVLDFGALENNLDVNTVVTLEGNNYNGLSAVIQTASGDTTLSE